MKGYQNQIQKPLTLNLIFIYKGLSSNGQAFCLDCSFFNNKLFDLDPCVPSSTLYHQQNFILPPTLSEVTGIAFLGNPLLQRMDPNFLILHHHLVFECHLRIRGVIESSRYRAKLEFDSIKNLKLELDQAFF